MSAVDDCGGIYPTRHGEVAHLPAGAEEDLRDANLVVRTAQAEGHHQSLHRDLIGVRALIRIVGGPSG